MVVITNIVTTDSPCTVCFDEPLPKTDYVGLISCTLCNSWNNLKQSGAMSWLNPDDSLKKKQSFPPGHYTLESIAKEIENAFKRYSELIPTRHGSTPVSTVLQKSV